MLAVSEGHPGNFNPRPPPRVSPSYARAAVPVAVLTASDSGERLSLVALLVAAEIGPRARVAAECAARTMLEAHEWDDVLGRLVGVQFRGTERIAPATFLDALGAARDKETRQKAGKRARSRPCMMLRIRISRIKRGASDV